MTKDNEFEVTETAEKCFKDNTALFAECWRNIVSYKVI